MWDQADLAVYPNEIVGAFGKGLTSGVKTAKSAMAGSVIVSLTGLLAVPTPDRYTMQVLLINPVWKRIAYRFEL